MLSFESGSIGIVANGRVIGPFDEDEEFIPADFLLLERFAMKSSVEKVHTAMESQLGKLEFFHNQIIDTFLRFLLINLFFVLLIVAALEGCKSNVFMKAVCLLANKPQSKSRFKLTDVGEEYR